MLVHGQADGYDDKREPRKTAEKPFFFETESEKQE